MNYNILKAHNSSFFINLQPFQFLLTRKQHLILQLKLVAQCRFSFLSLVHLHFAMVLLVLAVFF